MSLSIILTWENDDTYQTHHGRNTHFGCVDMSGNVWEWTDSWWDADEIAQVLRGCSWHGGNYVTRADRRYSFNPHYWSNNFGFRVCSPIGSGS